MAKNENKEKEQETTQVTTPTPDPAEEAKKEAQAILDAAKSEADKITEEAKTKAEEEAKAAFEAKRAELEEAAKAEADATAAAPAPAHKMVPVRLFKDNEKYKDDVFVAVNGKSYQIKRGETVMVPDFVAEVLERSTAQDQATANLIDRQSREYEAEAARLGV